MNENELYRRIRAARIASAFCGMLCFLLVVIMMMMVTIIIFSDGLRQ